MFGVIRFLLVIHSLVKVNCLLQMFTLSETRFTTAQFSAMMARVVKPLIPLDIVYGGERIIIHYDILEPKEWLYFYRANNTDRVCPYGSSNPVINDRQPAF
ncbi:hypothetical protein AYI74_17075 [Shewanella algae]|nr:hypothetical protein AYI74_17075 [Shewanella algae]